MVVENRDFMHRRLTSSPLHSRHDEPHNSQHYEPQHQSKRADGAHHHETTEEDKRHLGSTLTEIQPPRRIEPDVVHHRGASRGSLG